MFTKAKLINENGKEIEITNFGSFSVLPKYQHKGIDAQSYKKYNSQKRHK